jgi:putative tricarboxylic transport membrane protein
MKKLRALRPQPLFDLLLLVSGAAIAVVSWHYGFGTFSRPGPGLYPFFVGAGITLFALLLLLADLRAESDSAPLDREAAQRLALMTGMFCFWILAMPLLGYVAVTLLSTFAFAKIMRLEGWRKPLALSAGTALFIYALFDVWLYIDLPRGLLG